MSIEELLNLDVGKKFTAGNKTFKVIQSDKCEGCYFYNNGCGHSSFTYLRPSCDKFSRKDKTNVIFVEVENE